MTKRDRAYRARRASSRYSGGRIGGGVGSYGFGEEDLSPSEGIVNLADAMLVLACGLMMALLSFWNLDLPDVSVRQIAPQTDMTKIETIEKKIDEDSLSGAGYDDLGRVYQDPDTGQMYLILPDESDLPED